MKLPEYQVTKDEAAWVAVQTATAALVTAVLLALDVDAMLAAPAGVMAGTVVRVIIGFLLPSSGSGT